MRKVELSAATICCSNDLRSRLYNLLSCSNNMMKLLRQLIISRPNNLKSRSDNIVSCSQKIIKVFRQLNISFRRLNNLFAQDN